MRSIATTIVKQAARPTALAAARAVVSSLRCGAAAGAMGARHFHASQTVVGKKLFKDAEDFLPLEGTDHIEFYVANAKQSSHWFQTVMGFTPVAYAGLETGVKDKTTYVLQQGKIRVLLTSSMDPDSFINEHVRMHGDGVRMIALKTPDAVKALEETRKRGAKVFMEPTVQRDAFGEVVVSGIHTYGDTIHLFVERKNYNGVFMPGFQPFSAPVDVQAGKAPVGLQHIDHMVGNVGWGEMDDWCKFYREVMGFANLVSFDDKDISTEYTALMSKVMTNGNGWVKFPINEPAKGKKKSQIEEYLDFYKGAGCQHIAVQTDNILHTVAELRRRGCEFLKVPDSYYDSVPTRVGQIEEDLNEVKKLNILVDRDEDGYLLQIFTKPITDRPTVFFEIIQRKGAHSFGKGNFKALFESIELEQGKRGTL